VRQSAIVCNETLFDWLYYMDKHTGVANCPVLQYGCRDPGSTVPPGINERRKVARPRRTKKKPPPDDEIELAGESGKSAIELTDVARERQEADTKQIIKKIRSGHKELFSKLVDRYRNQVAGIAFKMVGDYDDAKDITQMVFVKTFYNLERFDPSKRFSTWLYRIAVNASIDYVRKFRKHKFEELDDIKESKELSARNPEQLFQLKELKSYVMTAAERLNEKQRDAFIYKDVKGLEIDEIAGIMGMPQATVRWYLHRARKRIRNDLQKRYPGVLRKLGIYQE